MTRILVLEDEPLIAFDLADQLIKAKFDVLGPVHSNCAATELLASMRCDGAILDINLGHETAEPVARDLIARSIPFITLSTYSLALPPRLFRRFPFVPKPVNRRALVAALLEVGLTP